MMRFAPRRLYSDAEVCRARYLSGKLRSFISGTPREPSLCTRSSLSLSSLRRCKYSGAYQESDKSEMNCTAGSGAQLDRDLRSHRSMRNPRRITFAV